MSTEKKQAEDVLAILEDVHSYLADLELTGAVRLFGNPQHARLALRVWKAKDELRRQRDRAFGNPHHGHRDEEPLRSKTKREEQEN